jgi:hypothetical protein
MDQDVANKRQELFAVLSQIESKMTSLDSKGLSAALFDYRRQIELLDSMKQECNAEAAKRNG